MPAPDLSNTPRMEQLLRDGKLYLSMNDAVALAMENNLDIAIQRYNLNIADTDILRAKAGASTLGVNSGIVSGHARRRHRRPQRIGRLRHRRHQRGLGGAGTGTGGLVNSTLGSGPPITSFDPVLTGTLQMDRLYTQSSSIFSPMPVSNQNTGTANFSYLQGFKTGTNLSVGFNNTHTTTNSPTATYSPTITSGFNFRLSPNTCCRVLASRPTRDLFGLPRTTARSPTSRSGCRSSPPWTRSRTSTGTWCSRTRT